MLLGLYIWETNLIETVKKMNANRRNCFCCFVLSYCDRRNWIAVDENGWQSTKLNNSVSKLIDQRRNWNEHSHKLETHFLNLNEEMTKMGGKTYNYKKTLTNWILWNVKFCRFDQIKRSDWLSSGSYSAASWSVSRSSLTRNWVWPQWTLFGSRLTLVDFGVYNMH